MQADRPLCSISTRRLPACVLIGDASIDRENGRRDERSGDLEILM